MNREPFYWLTEHSNNFLYKGYLSEGETPKTRIRDIANHAQKLLDIEGFADKFYGYMSKGYYSLSSPVWSNFGKARGLGVSCFGSHTADSVPGILKTVSEIGVMSKLGGGTACYLGDVRPRGSSITDNGQSTGAVHFMELFQATTDVIAQGCYDNQTEILTENGWMFFEDLLALRNVKVAQVGDNDVISFVEPTEYFKYRVNEKLLHFKDSVNIDLLVTKNHNMVFKYDKKVFVKNADNTRTKSYSRIVQKDYRTKTAEECPTHRDVKFVHSSYAPSGTGLSDLERLYIAVQADGNIVKNCNNAVRFRFSKNRKKERLEQLLNSFGVDYSYKYSDKDCTHNFYVNFGMIIPKTFSKWVDITNISKEWAEDFLAELSHWDGSGTETCFRYSSIVKSNVDIAQSIASMAGFKSYTQLNMREKEPNKKPIYNLSIIKGQYFGVEKMSPTEVDYNGYVYCVEVPSHKLIIRRGGHTLVCGNSQRRGRTAAYLPVDHGDIEEFLKVATEGHPVQNMTTAVVVPSNWMQEMIDGDKSKRGVWAKVLKARSEIGFPYILYKDNANNHTKPDVYSDKGLDVNHSQLCSEIMLNTDADHSFVCVLSSMNLLHYDEWKDTDAVETLTYFLDAVVTDFLHDLESYRDSSDPDKRETFRLMERAYKFAKRERALGVGVLGWHSLLQSKLTPFESRDAAKLNLEIAKLMKQKTYKASRELAQIYGEPELLVGYGRRNSALLAIAPTTSSAFILGQVSQSIEPLFSNYYIKDLAKAKVAIKNVYLEKVLEEKGYNTKTVWDNIMSNDGSVYGLSDEVLPEELKAVFKTFREISQEAVIDQAAARQEYIDQGQSLNLMITNDLSPKQINALHIRAWQLGIKSLYYQHSVNQSQEFARGRRNETCQSCEG